MRQAGVHSNAANHLLMDTHVGKAIPFSMAFPLKIAADSLGGHGQRGE